MPVRGEMIPPNRKVKKPRVAEAFPEFFFSRFKARVVEVGNIIPKKKRNRKKVLSMMTRDDPEHKVMAVTQPKIIKPITPIDNAFSLVLKKMILRLPNMIPMALSPKHRL